MSEIYIPLEYLLLAVPGAFGAGYWLGFRGGAKRIARHVRRVTLSPSLFGG